jgi:hypothetical protein
MEQRSSSRRTLGALLLVMAASYCFLGFLTETGLFSHEPLDSYTLQAWNWLHGRMYVENGDQYTWLELAIYNDRYYVSFPPIPSVVMVPLVLLFGMDTPNNLLVGLYGLLSAALAYRIMVCRGRTPRVAAFWALVMVFGSNMLWMTTNGGVWFQAQALCMVFCLGGVLAAVTGHRALSTTLVALGVGCRPMVGLFLPILVLCFAWEDREEGYFRALCRQGRCVVGPVCIGLCLMAYNLARFGNPLEFGHNYLPEFTRSTYGQFHISYLWPNLQKLLFTYPTLSEGRLQFDIFNGFACYVANPLFLILFVWQLRSLKKRNITLPGVLITVGIVAELVLLCLHKTLGGWQFGSRYSCDVLPFALWYGAEKAPKGLSNWELCLGGLAVAFNAYGAMYMYLYG